MCLNCHGAPGKEIAAATVSKIQELYPDDSAVDFKEGDLRGVWHIVFKSQQN
jgi:cytochrome c553